jgi:hypothetical protein
MRKTLLATVVLAAVVGFGGIATAQSQMGGESNKSMSGATQEKGGGSMSGTQSGSKTLSPSSSQLGGQSAQGMERGGKDNERLGQGASQEQKGMTRGAQEERRGMEQNGTQQERGLQKNQRGAQEERGTNVKGAQEQRGTTERNTTEERGRTGVNTSTNAENRGARGGSVQLSEGQRSQIKTIIERKHGPRLGSNVHFDVRVGTRIPRSVHVAVLPEDIVTIIPEYRGFDYFLIGDEIVVVDPRTLEIVATIPA